MNDNKGITTLINSSIVLTTNLKLIKGGGSVGIDPDPPGDDNGGTPVGGIMTTDGCPPPIED